MNLEKETRELIESSHQLRLSIHTVGRDLAREQKQLAAVSAKYWAYISTSKEYKDADPDQRKAALTKALAEDKKYLELEQILEDFKNDIELFRIDLQHNSDLIKLNMALLRSGHGE